MNLCPRHRELLPLLREAQRAEKRERNELNRAVQPGKNNRLSVLCASIRRRKCVLMNLSFKGPGSCEACEYSRHCRRDVFAECLPSSVAERFGKNEEVVSSNLAGGSPLK